MYPIVRCTVQTCQVSALHKHLDKEELHSRQILIEWLQGEKIYDSLSPSSTEKLSIKDKKVSNNFSFFLASLGYLFHAKVHMSRNVVAIVMAEILISALG